MFNYTHMYMYLQAHTQTMSRSGKNVVTALSTLLDNCSTNQRGVPISTNTHLLHVYTCYTATTINSFIPRLFPAFQMYHTAGKFHQEKIFWPISPPALIGKTFVRELLVPDYVVIFAVLAKKMP